jgi:hypothetical protein
MMARALLASAFLWPILLASGWWVRAGGQPADAGWSALVYAAASHVCHQRPERSFQTAGTQWPVCGRCSGLYLVAPVGAVFGIFAPRRWRGSLRGWLAAGAIPTAMTIGLEWAGLPVSSGVRAVAAAPLGAIVATVIVRTAAGRADSIK